MDQHLHPTPFNETQIRILDAAVRCIQLWGIEKTSINDISKQAGVTRPTVYSYFSGRHEVIRAALLYSGYELGRKLVEHMNQFATPAERLLESVLFAVEKLPKEPYLALITSADLTEQVNQDALNDPEGQQICLYLFREILRGKRVSEKQLLEITEVTVRFTLSLIMIKGPVDRSNAELRQFLKRRLLPSVGLV